MIRIVVCAHRRLSLFDSKGFCGLLLKKHAALVLTNLFLRGTLQSFSAFLLKFVIWTLLDQVLLFEISRLGIICSPMTGSDLLLLLNLRPAPLVFIVLLLGTNN